MAKHVAIIRVDVSETTGLILSYSIGKLVDGKLSYAVNASFITAALKCAQDMTRDKPQNIRVTHSVAETIFKATGTNVRALGVEVTNDLFHK